MHGKLMLTCDFNIHIELMRDPDTITFMDFLDCFNLQNHVNFSTHIQHHHLDLVISDVSDIIVSSSNSGHLLSDHWLIHIKLHINKPVPLNTKISYRKIKSIDHQDIKESFKSELFAIHQINNLHQTVNTYNSKMGKIWNVHAPLKTKKSKPSHRQPWFMDNIRTEIQLRRHRDAMCLRDPLDYNLMAFYYQRRYCGNLIKSAQRLLFLGTIKKQKHDSKALFAITNKLLHRGQ